MIYFVQAESGGQVKIGYSRKLPNRLSALQMARPDRLVNLRTIEHGGPFAESWLHDRYAHLRRSGEWFEFCPTMMTVEVPKNLLEEPSPEQAASSLSNLIAAALSRRIGRDKEYGTGEVAGATGLSRATIDNLLNGNNDPSGRALMALLTFFDESFAAEILEPTGLTVAKLSDRRAAALRKVAEGMAELREIG